MTDRGTCLRWLAKAGMATLICLSFFIAFPGFDLRVSGVFSSPDTGFVIRHMAGWNAVRNTMIALTDGVIVVAAAMLLVSVAVPRWQVIRRRVLLFCITSYAVGPGFLVNAFLKSYSQRARPWNIVDFGGDALYSRPFELAGQCSRHCSFVSGEASALTTIAGIGLLVFVPCLPRYKQRRANFVIVSVAVSGSLLRVAFGAHFISDVIFAGLFMSLLIPALYLAFGLHHLSDPFLARPGGGRLLPLLAPLGRVPNSQRARSELSQLAL